MYINVTTSNFQGNGSHPFLVMYPLVNILSNKYRFTNLEHKNCKCTYNYYCIFSFEFHCKDTSKFLKNIRVSLGAPLRTPKGKCTHICEPLFSSKCA